MTTMVGIDPGVMGGLVVLKDGRCVLQRRGQDLQMARATGKGKDWDRCAVLKVVQDIHAQEPGALWTLEKLRPFHGISAKHAFGMGRSHEIWVSALTCTGVDFIEVEPQDWQGAVVGIGRGLARKKGVAGTGLQKLRAQYLASLVPGLDLTPGKCTKVQDGLADALAVALHRCAATRALYVPDVWPEELLLPWERA